MTRYRYKIYDIYFLNRIYLNPSIFLSIYSLQFLFLFHYYFFHRYRNFKFQTKINFFILFFIDPFKMNLLTPYWSLDILIVSSSLMIAVYLYASWKLKYWSRRGIMQITPSPLFGNFKKCILFQKSVSEIIRELYGQNEGLPFMGFYIFYKPFFLVRDIELVKHILVKDFNTFANKHTSADSKNDRIGYSNLFIIKNPAWKYLRGKLTSVFTSGKLKKMFDLMLIIGKNLEKHLELLNLDGKSHL